MQTAPNKAPPCGIPYGHGVFDVHPDPSAGEQLRGQAAPGQKSRTAGTMHVFLTCPELGQFLTPAEQYTCRTSFDTRNGSLHHNIWKYYGRRLFELFDLRQPDLWNRYVKYLMEYYRLQDENFRSRDISPFITGAPRLWKVCSQGRSAAQQSPAVRDILRSWCLRCTPRQRM
jgi:hypothetical protein